MKSLTIVAEQEALETVQEFVDGILEEAECPMKTQFQINVAVEEIFVNIASYAYLPGTGTAQIDVVLPKEGSSVTVIFRDHGVPFDPLAKEDADTSAEALMTRTGGLGILMTKKMMDEVAYEFCDGMNVLTIRKNW